MVRRIVSADFRAHCKPLFKKLGIMPLPTIFIFQQLLQIHRKSHTFVTGSMVHSYPTRGANLLRSKKARLEVTKNNSLRVDLFNILPSHIKELNYFKFKSKLKIFLLKHCFYNTKEYIVFTKNNRSEFD